jgi:predicted nucleic-acid-binding protein
MIGVDSNVLVHLFVDDDDAQRALAMQFLGQRNADDPAFISTPVLVEVTWVLSRIYRVPAADIRRVVLALLRSRDVLIEAAPAVRRAIVDSEEAGTGLADAIIAHAAIDAGCDGIVTFDKRAQRLPGMLPVR